MPNANRSFPQRVIYVAWLPSLEQACDINDLLCKTTGELELRYDVCYPIDVREGDKRPAMVFIIVGQPPHQDIGLGAP